MIPVGQLWIGKLIMDQVGRAITGLPRDPGRIWVLLAYEIGLAVLSDLLSRAINLCDSLLGDKFTNHELYLYLQKETAGLYAQMYELALRRHSETFGVLVPLAVCAVIVVALWPLRRARPAASAVEHG